MQNRRSQIRKAAIKLFNRYGFKATSMEKIAREVGIKKGSLYAHISSKNELLYDVFGDAIEDVNSSLKEIVKSKIPADEKLRRAIDNHIKKELKHLDEYRLYLQERKFLPPRFEREYRRKRKINQDYIEKIVCEGKKTQIFRSDIDTKAITFHLFGMLNWVTQWYRRSGALSPDEISKSICELVFSGINLDRHIGAGR